MITNQLFPPSKRAFTKNGKLKQLCHDEVDPMLLTYHQALKAAEKQIRELTKEKKDVKTIMKRGYNHMMDVAFTVISSRKNGASASQILSALESRAHYCRSSRSKATFN